VLRMIFQRPPDVELKLGLEVRIGAKVLGTIIAAKVLDDGQVFLKLRLGRTVETPVSEETMGEPPTPTGLDGNNKVTSYQGVTNRSPHARDGLTHFPLEAEGGRR